MHHESFDDNYGLFVVSLDLFRAVQNKSVDLLPKNLTFKWVAEINKERLKFYVCSPFFKPSNSDDFLGNRNVLSSISD